MKFEENKKISSFEREKRKELKERLLKLKENYIKENEQYYKLFLLPNDNVIKAIDRFLVTHIKFKKEWIGIKELMFIIDKAQEYKADRDKKILKSK